MTTFPTKKPLNNRQFFALVLGLGVLLRLILMPFFAHVDLFSEYRRVFYVLDNGLFFDNAHRVVVFNVELLFAWASQLFIPISDELFHLPDPKQSVASLVDYRFFLNDPNIFRHLFFFKLPYLLFDIATATVIWKFIDKPGNKKIALILWLFNPVTIFAFYIFGRFEVISLFFLAATALQLKRHRLLLATFMFALALLSREINLLFVPFFLIALLDSKDHWLRNIAVVCLSTVIIAIMVSLPAWLMPKLGGDLTLFIDPNTVRSNETLNKLLSLGYYWFYPVIIALAALSIYAWEVSNRTTHAERYVTCSAVALFIYFAFNVHSVHYAAWLTIFPILSMQFGKKMVTPFLVFIATWITLWLLKTDAGVFTLFLAAPMSSEFIDMGYFPNFFDKHLATAELSLHQAIQIMRALFFVAMGFFTYRMLRKT